MDGRPDAVAALRARGRTARLLVERQDLADGGHVVDRDHDLEVERLARPGIDDLDVAVRSDAAEEPGDRVERPLRGAQADALERRRVRGSKALEPLEAEGEVGATLGAGDRVDLVDDDVLDAPQDLADLAREHQVQRFGGRDEDVRRAAGDLAAVLGRGVARAAGDGDRRDRRAEPLRRVSDAGQRRPQVALDVVGERLQRGDVQDADRTGLRTGPFGRRVGGEPVERPQERGEGLAGTGRGMDKRVATGGDGRPAAGLGVGRRLEARLEPLADGSREGGQRVGTDIDGRGHGTMSIGVRARLDQMF